MKHVSNAGQSVLQLDQCVRWGYSFWEYPVRFIWRILWQTCWKLLWHRLFWLRSLVLKCFGAKVSLKSQYFGSTWIERPYDLEVGEFTSIGPRVQLYNLAHLKIGSHTVLSQDVYVCGGTHDYTDATMPLQRVNIEIGDNVWICAGAFIGPGVKIGEGAVIGACAMVTQNVDPWMVVAGNPARVIKKRELKNRRRC